MPDADTLDERLRAVERALADAEELPDLDAQAELAATTDDLANRLDDLESRVDELDAAVQAVRGYVGTIRAVNEDVERRADAALAKAEAVDAPPDAPVPDPVATGPTEPTHREDDGTDGADRSLVDRLRERL
jgi:ABC-type transporter Mla subunit MlaD